VVPLPPDTSAPPLPVALAGYLLALTNEAFLERGPYQVLRIARAAEASLRNYETEVAQSAIAAGATWTELAHELQMTRQGVQRRYGSGGPNG
jgi:hypothetical protein